jgi:hypothetical protein
MPGARAVLASTDIARNHMQRTGIVCVLAVCVAVAASCDSSTDVTPRILYRATLNGASEVPATTSTATGDFSAQLLPDKTLSYSLTWTTGLTGTANGAHIHGPADATQTANILVDFALPPVGATNATINFAGRVASGNLDLKQAVTATVSGDSLIKLLDAGQLYVNVHTVANSGGEIRGQITRQ